MKCTECGAGLMDTDQFCPKCGARVIREKRCPDCGAALREGTKFCHKCGRLVEGGSAQKTSQETLDIPIDAIEKNILSETAAEIRADRGAPREPRRTTSAGGASRSASARDSAARGPAARSASDAPSRASSGSRPAARSAVGGSKSGHGAPGARRTAEPPAGKRTPSPEPPRRKRIDYREDDWEEEDWEDDDWDDDEDEGVDIITIMTAVAGCVLLVVVAVLGYNLYKQYAPKSYERQAQEQEQEESEPGDEEEPEQEEAEGQQIAADSGDGTYLITVISNVNVRDKPSTSGTSILMVAQAGDVYTCYGSTEGGEWYEIRLEDGTPGYVFHEYVSVDGNTAE